MVKERGQESVGLGSLNTGSKSAEKSNKKQENTENPMKL